MTNRLKRIQALGQAIWLDDLSRPLLDDGELARMIEEDAVSGVTSNPTIFKEALAASDRYADRVAWMCRAGLDPQEIFFRLAIADVRDACDLLQPIFDRTDGTDGHVSFELPPALAYDPQGSIVAAKELRRRIDRPNVLIKVPGTAEGVRAFEELTAAGISVNVTLLFAVPRYEAIANAYLNGLERRAEAGEAINRIASVASFFVSRVDTKVDAALEDLDRPDLRGRAAVANARIAYASFQRTFSTPRWKALSALGANLQRPLWASTSVKNPDYPDTLYVDELIGPHTVNTMPRGTLLAAREHATVARTVDRDVADAHRLIEELRGIGTRFDDIVSNQLVSEGVDAFAESFNSVIRTIRGEAQEAALPAHGHAVD